MFPLADIDWTAALQHSAQSALLLGPEAVLIAIACLVLLLDLVLPQERSGPVLAWPTLLGVLVAGWLVGHDLSSLETSRTALFGTVAIDRFASFFKLIILIGTAFSIVLSHEFRWFRDRRMGEFYSLMLLAVAGMFFMVGATDLVVGFIAIELVSIPSFALVCFLRQDRHGTEAAMKYVLYSAFATGLMLYGLSIAYGFTGSTRFGSLSAMIPGTNAHKGAAAIAMLLTFAGFGFKMGAAPFHWWAPDVYQGAPTPVTAWLSVTSKTAGVAIFTRFLLAFAGPNGKMAVAGFDWAPALVLVSGVTMTIGNLGGLWQTSLKRLLAYSSVAHVGYILMGLAAIKPVQLGDGALALSSPDVLGGGGGPAVAFYLLAYLFMNLGAFSVVVALSNRVGGDDLSLFRGIGRRSPFLGFCLAMFLFGLIGLPPTAGFTGKLQLFMAAIYAKYYALVIIAGLNTAVSVYYYMKVLKVVWLDGGDDPDAREPLPASTGLTITAFVLLVPVVTLGLWFDGFARRAQSLDVLIRAFN